MFDGDGTMSIEQPTLSDFTDEETDLDDDPEPPRWTDYGQEPYQQSESGDAGISESGVLHIIMQMDWDPDEVCTPDELSVDETANINPYAVQRGDDA